SRMVEEDEDRMKAVVVVDEEVE
ncbi:hypothetical protein A2U01_0087405, partial [Trifolium medium]|nr:hypothetical protein [Trifolium medium]